MRFTALVPMLQCDDIEATKAWYQSVLGFACVGEVAGNWCRLERDGAAIMFMKNDHPGAPNATATQYISVDDVMTLWDSIKDRCRAEWGPERMPYGMLEFANNPELKIHISWVPAEAGPRESLCRKKESPR
jgi:hypothetical protein